MKKCKRLLIPIILLIIFGAIVTFVSIAKFNKNKLETYDFSDIFNFPIEKLQYADDMAFQVLAEAYGDIDFFSEFEFGDIEQYDFFKDRYIQLLKNKVSFINPNTGKEQYINEYNVLAAEDYTIDLYNYIYYFFDMDEDGTPELSISDGINFFSIFKYNLSTDNYYLWYEGNSTWLRLIGSKTVIWNREDTEQVFYKLDKDGKEILAVYFFEREDFNNKLKKEDTAYMVGLPIYADKRQNIKLDWKVKGQASLDTGHKGLYYFRVTKEQYDILTRNFFEAEKIAKENLGKVSYTYRELFGNR